MKLHPSIIATCFLCPTLVLANDFPTQARVEYVLGCMEIHGGQSYDTLYPCVCSIDKIASKLTYAQYTEAETFTVMFKTPGERGGAFRDAPGARDLVKGLKKAQEEAKSSCFVKAKKTVSP
jgi:hypothetical protein